MAGRSGTVDLTAYAGKQVEVSISYISDWGTQGVGVFVDDATVLVDGTTAHETSFEAGLDGWTTPEPPAGSNVTNTWVRSLKLFDEGSATVTDDTVFTGFGAEGMTSAETRAEFVTKAMEHLLP